MKNEWEAVLRNPENFKRLVYFLEQSDYEFFKGLMKGMSDEDFEEFCKEFPEARVVLDDSEN